jgi:ornithine decarboxylase
MNDIAKDFISKNNLKKSFYIADFKMLEYKINQWQSLLPKIEPFYAIKCNPDKEIIKFMINKGLSFDCASMNEIKTVIKLGDFDYPNKIIYSHPVKSTDDLEYAINKGIKYTTFDSISELHKIKEYAPNMKCLIRLYVNNPTARIQLGLKYGVHIEEYKELLNNAKNMNINIVGTSFHVGSASNDPNVFKDGILFAKEVFQYARTLGYSMNLLDIGGGFTKENFEPCSKVINENISDSFWNNTKIIAEPGRFFAEDIFTFITPIIGNRERNNIFHYWIGDGLYGSYNCILYDAQEPIYEVIRNPLLENDNIDDNELFDSIIFGSTCDSLDKVGEVKLPKLHNGDFLLNKRFGAYTIAGATNFNGINMMDIQIFYI